MTPEQIAALLAERYARELARQEELIVHLRRCPEWKAVRR